MSQSNVVRISGGDAEWRRLIFLIVGLILVVLATTSRVVGAEPSSIWRPDFKAALAEAEQQKLPLLIHFHADWCMPCQRMEREVFATPAVRDLLGSHFVAVKVNSDQRQDLVKRYGVETLPSDVIVDSLSGRVIAMTSGFQDRTGYIANASQAESRFVNAHAADLVITKSEQQSGDPTQPAIGSSTDRQAELGDARPIVGLDGFSPVALAKHRQWNRGSPRLAWDYKDVTYHLGSRDELIEFRNNPEAFAPKLLGCDPVILWESDKAVAGDIRYGAFFDDELFLFRSDERRRQFKANPEKYIRLQHALKVDQIERTVLR